MRITLEALLRYSASSGRALKLRNTVGYISADSYFVLRGGKLRKVHAW
jgi:hypothetical protein